MNANEGMLLALSSGLDRITAACQPSVDQTLRQIVAERLGPEAEKKIYDDAVRMAESVQDLDMPRTLTAQQISNYLGNAGEHCPDCLSTDISGGSVDISAGHATQHMDCSYCGLQWDDEYELVTLRRTRFGVKSKEPEGNSIG